MKELLMSVPENEYPFFLKLVESLDFVTIKESEKKATRKETFLKDLRQSVKEVNDIKAGRIKGVPAKRLLNEL